MPPQLKILKVNHINQIVDDYDAAVAHLEDLFGGQFLREMWYRPGDALFGRPRLVGDRS